MNEKLIVNAQWVTIPKLGLRQRLALAAAALAQNLRPEDLTALSPMARGFLEEKSIQISGNPAKLLEALRSLPEYAPENEKPLWEERLFLRGFAQSRLGRDAAAGADFSRLPARFASRIQTERALAFLNRGALAEAESLFVEARRDRENLDPFSACTLLGGLSLAYIHQGDFKGAESCLKNRRAILREHPSPILSFGTELYEILLSLERNHFDEADRQIRRALASVNEQSVNGFFLLHLKLRLNLARNDLKGAGELMAHLKSLLAQLKIPDGVLDLRIEEIEWHLRCRRPGDARAIGESLLDEATAKRDDHQRFRLILLRALALWQEGKPNDAVKEMEAAISLGEAKQYRPTLSWAFFHAAGISLAAGQPVRAKLFLNRGRRLSEELRLPVRLAAFSYIAEALENKFASASSLVSLAMHQEIGPELEYFLTAYQILGSVSLQVTQGRHQETVSEPNLRQKLFREPGFFWFQKEGVLIANRGKNEVRHLDLSGQEQLLLLFRLFWNAAQENQGLRLEDVHGARHTSPFREHLHAAGAKMALSRLRSQLAPRGLRLEYSREKSRYILAFDGPAYTIQSVSPKRRENRENEILQRIAMESFVSTRTLCAEFLVTRQALHPTLKRLCDEGKLKLVRRGPISGYLYRQRGKFD